MPEVGKQEQRNRHPCDEETQTYGEATQAAASNGRNGFIGHEQTNETLAFAAS
jgi:hypothetical protein